MTTYFDSAAQATTLNTGDIYSFGSLQTFWINLVSNLLAGQGTGPATTFTVRGAGVDAITVAYGETRSLEVTGSDVSVVVPSSPPAVALRIVLSAE
ncbi:MAG: hypothetical protein ACREEC_14485, partial [Thermoplasmata archaeon]